MNELLQNIPDFIVKYFSQFVGAILILVVGFYIARIVKIYTNRIFKSHGYSTSKFISKIIYISILVIVVITSLKQIGVSTSLFSSIFVILLGTVLLSFSISYGIASIDIMKNILSFFYYRNLFKVGQTIRINNIEGEIEKINNISMILKTQKGKVVIPLKNLFTDIVEIINE